MPSDSIMSDFLPLRSHPTDHLPRYWETTETGGQCGLDGCSGRARSTHTLCSQGAGKSWTTWLFSSSRRSGAGQAVYHIIHRSVLQIRLVIRSTQMKEIHPPQVPRKCCYCQWVHKRQLSLDEPVSCWRAGRCKSSWRDTQATDVSLPDRKKKKKKGLPALSSISASRLTKKAPFYFPTSMFIT